MAKYNFNEVEARMRELNTQLADMSADDENRETVEREFNQLYREYNMNKSIAERENMAVKPSKREELNQQFREFLRSGRRGDTFSMRETGNTMSTTTAITPNFLQGILDEEPADALVYQAAGCPVITGASGLNDWAYAGDVTVSIQSELTSLDSQVIDFSKVTATQQRLTVKVCLSWQSINNASTDLIALAQRKAAKGFADAINFAACSTAQFGSNFYGGFAHEDKLTDTYTTYSYATAMEQVAAVAAKNYDVARYGAFVMGPEDYYALKATSRDSGSGLMVIDDEGRLGGFPVFVTNAINRTTFQGSTSGHNIGFGLFNYLPCLQHGDARVTIDGASAAAADVDGVYVIINADWSMTDLYPEAFCLYTQSE